MKQKNILRLFVVGFGLICLSLIVWNFMPPTIAQKIVKNNVDTISTSEPVEIADESSFVMLNAVKINAKSDEAQALRHNVGDFSGKRMHLVKFDAPIQPEWHKMLLNNGLEIIDYIPSYTYLVYGDVKNLQKLQSEAQNLANHIEWEGTFRDEYRMSPDVYKVNAKTGLTALRSDEFQIQLYKDEATNAETLNFATTLQTKPIKGQQEILHYVNFVVGLDENGLKQMAARPDVISIHPYIEPKKLDERQNIILTGNLNGNVPIPGNYLTYLSGKGFTQAQFTASNFAVDVTDSGVDAAVPATPNHFGLRTLGNPASSSRYVYSRLEGTANGGSTIQGCDGHGNINAHIVGGYVPDGAPFNAFPHADASGFRYGLGVAPFVKIGSSTIFDPNSYTNPNFANLQSRAYNDGARISTNSWGAPAGGAYNSDSQAYDALTRDAQPTGSAFPVAGNQQMVLLFAAGNDGSGANTVGSPGTGKNVITVGAAENVHAFGGNDGCGTTDTEANSANDIVGFSSRGPLDDSRVKPDIMAPGTHVTGGVAQSAVVSPVSGNGSQLACFTGGGVCGGVGNNFFPAGQQWYSASSGTSHSTPAVAGAAALIRQHFINQSLAPPSPAMTKAVLMNSARYMTGVSANDNLYSNNQGMGMVHLNQYFSIFSAGNTLRDQVPADKFTATAQTRTFTGTADLTKPLKVTLTWTDAPGSTVGNAYNNNLDLEVVINGNTYRGNVFTGRYSTTGGTADVRNNSESVFLPASALAFAPGDYTVTVRATNINSNGVPNDADPLDQDFALVISQAGETKVQAVNTSIVSESALPANNAPDPGESLLVALNLQNVGSIGSNPVTVTLQNSGGIENPSAAQNYGSLAAETGTGSRNFTFRVPNGTVCGSTITLSFLVNDGVNPFTYTQVFRVGIQTTTFTQNFDAVIAPALPVGWTAAQNGVNTGWVTSTTTPNSAPNAAFVPDPNNVGLGVLDTPAIAIPGAGGILRFNLNYNTESTFDGTVLEMKIGAGAFQDILTAGGSFVTGGYNGTLNTGFANPLPGRAAWTGNSNGYVAVQVNLPAAANGQSVQFRWRMGSDNSTGGVGVRLDNVVVQSAAFSCAVPTAASVSVGGRIFSPSGIGIRRAMVTMTNESGETRTALTNQFGYYRFDEVGAGETYILSVRHKQYVFAPQSVNITGSLTDLNFTAQP